MNQTAEPMNNQMPDRPLLNPQAGRPTETRVYGFFPAQVRGIDSTGAPFHTQTLLDNFGATEFDLRLTRSVNAGERLLVVTNIHEATIALHGRVICAEPQSDGTHRITVAVAHHRFL